MTMKSAGSRWQTTRAGTNPFSVLRSALHPDVCPGRLRGSEIDALAIGSEEKARFVFDDQSDRIDVKVAVLSMDLGLFRWFAPGVYHVVAHISVPRLFVWARQIIGSVVVIQIGVPEHGFQMGCCVARRK